LLADVILPLFASIFIAIFLDMPCFSWHRRCVTQLSPLITASAVNLTALLNVLFYWFVSLN